MKALRLCLFLTLALVLVASPVAGARGNPNPGALPPTSRIQGLTYSEWSVIWWQHQLAIPAAVHPSLGYPWPDCYLTRMGNVGLGVAFYVPEGQVAACQMPSGMMLFLPIGAGECSTLEVGTPWYGENEQELTACAQSTAAVAHLQVEIDGVALADPTSYLLTSPLFDFTAPEENVLGVPGGSGQAVTYGGWLMMAPLSPGQHSLHIQVYFPFLDVSAELTYVITVTN